MRRGERAVAGAVPRNSRSAGRLPPYISEPLPTAEEVTSIAPSATPTRTSVRIHRRCRIDARCRIDRIFINHRWRIGHSGATMKHQPIRHAPASEFEPRHVAILAYPGVALLDAVGPLEVFAAANLVLAERSPRCAKPYQVEIWSEHVGAIDGSCGVSLNATRSIATAAPFELDTVIVAGAPAVSNPASRPCFDWLRQSTGGIRPGGGICTGRFLLPEAGLLNRCRARAPLGFSS